MKTRGRFFFQILKHFSVVNVPYGTHGRAALIGTKAVPHLTESRTVPLRNPGHSLFHALMVAISRA